MSKYIVVIFPSEAKAYEGRRALGELHNEGSITAYASAIITKEKNGHIAVKESADSGPLGAGVGALVGGLAGLVGGPVGVAVGVGTGSLFGSFTDLMNLGVNADFLDAVSETLKPGKSALVAEISEDWVTPIDVRMEALGGNVIRKQRYDFEDEQEERAIRADQAEVARLKEEWKQASAERKAKLKARLDDAQAKLDAAAKHAGERARKLEQQGKAKLQELQHQMAHATGEAKAKLDARMAETRTDYERRSKLLKQAGELAKQALAA